MAAGTLNRAQRRAEKKVKKQSHKASPLVSIKALYPAIESHMAQAQWADALRELQPLLREHPTQSRLWRNAGRCYQQLGHINEAVTHYQQVLSLSPNDAESLYQLGIIMQQAGNMQQAIGLYEASLRHQPNHTELLHILIPFYLQNNQPEKALSTAFIAVKHLPDDNSFWRYFVQALGQTKQFTPTPEMLQFLSEHAQLASKTAYSFATAAAFCLMAGIPGLREWAERPDCRQWHIFEHPLLTTLLTRCVVPQRFIEQTLCHIRAACLTTLSEQANSNLSELPLSMLEALPHAFFLSEYIQHIAPSEQVQLETLIAETLATTTPTPRFRTALHIIACYQPLNQLADIDSWRAHIKADDYSLQGLCQLMIDEPAQEQRIATNIEGFGRHENSVSQHVRAQYESNPYPRWSHVADTPLESPQTLLNNLLGDDAHTIDLRVAEQHQHVLVAGCGTGLQTLGVQGRYPTAHVTNIDLSRASMAYAIAKMRELNIMNDQLSFYHGDILELDQLPAATHPFDIIESVGVLHHMADPMAGWKILTSHLRPGGLMRIGLYSRAARAAIIEQRSQWARAGYALEDMSLQQLREARQQLITQGKSAPFERTSDFFTASECRDLLFHVQEHQFTLPQIQTALDELGLKFLGFVAQDSRIFNLFHQTHGSGADIRDLTLWDAVEKAHPQCFIAMYNFYLYKPV